jgi:hypothetical protein
VKPDNVFAAREELARNVIADEPGRTCDQRCHGLKPSVGGVVRVKPRDVSQGYRTSGDSVPPKARQQNAGQTE